MQLEKKVLNTKNWRLPSRHVAIILEYIGSLIFLGAFVLEFFLAFSQNTLIFYYGTALLFLAVGVVLRRYHDQD